MPPSPGVSPPPEPPWRAPGKTGKVPSTLGPPQTPESPQFFELTENDTEAYGSVEADGVASVAPLAGGTTAGEGAGGIVTWRLKGRTIVLGPSTLLSVPAGGHDADIDLPPVTDKLADIETYVPPLSITYVAVPDTVTVPPVTVPVRWVGVSPVPAVTPVTV
jgi:hypothetical protein